MCECVGMCEGGSVCVTECVLVCVRVGVCVSL